MLKTESGARELAREECLALLATVPVGRLVYTDRALPAVVPVDFVLDAGQVVIRTGGGSALAAAVRGSIVAFEVDDVDASVRNGWTVTITGQARQVVDPLELARLSELGLEPYAPGRDDFIVVPVELVTGRRVGSGPLALAH